MMIKVERDILANEQNILLYFMVFFAGRNGIDGQEKKSRHGTGRALKRMDYVLDYYAAPDFVEVVGRAGGDTVTLRIYDNGSVYER